MQPPHRVTRNRDPNARTVWVELDTSRHVFGQGTPQCDGFVDGAQGAGLTSSAVAIVVMSGDALRSAVGVEPVRDHDRGSCPTPAPDAAGAHSDGPAAVRWDTVVAERTKRTPAGFVGNRVDEFPPEEHNRTCAI
jgi:hypothetical protein